MGGSDAKKGDYPFAIYLYNAGEKSYCGGSIISDTWILTAAHCIKGSTINDISVFIGEITYDINPGKGAKVAEIHNHPQYNDQTMINDISLLKLSSPITDKNAATISIDTTNVGDGIAVTALGWGFTAPGGSTPAQTLKKGELTTLSKAQCSQKDTKFDGNNGARICVAGDTGTDTCPGDSGGPLIRKVDGKNVLVGITSFGTAGPGQQITTSCGGKGMVSLFTHPNYFMSFIKSTTGELRQIQASNSSDG
ncbi:Kallikrein-14 [Coemansia sp. S16]|nr:Kallikrein-14 [Coemansia sp. S680]KAJ2036942.1 Kallikrein-14 [Coemansia sp. S16]KAJ2419602.1 Kallikrein-14 [Coemansia sp. RSA 2531]